jgi:hypothetical protein
LNVYNHIAHNNTDKALEVCKKYGYMPANYNELSFCLEDIVAKEGEPALKEIMEIHPDKEVLLELFEPKPEPPVMERNRDCSCMMNADGNNQQQGIASQTNLVILVAAMIVAISVISIKTK